MSKVLIDRKLLERLQERLDPHRDAVDWGMVCDTFRAHAAEPVQGEATVKECLTVELVENSTYGGLHIKEWRNHGLSAGRHTLYTSPAKPDAELVALLRLCRNDFAGVSMTHNLVDRIDAKLAELQGDKK